jgi:hypothetical protein
MKFVIPAKAGIQRLHPNGFPTKRCDQTPMRLGNASSGMTKHWRPHGSSDNRIIETSE